MHSTPYFSLPLHPGNQPSSVRPYGRLRKKAKLVHTALPSEALPLTGKNKDHLDDAADDQASSEDDHPHVSTLRQSRNSADSDHKRAGNPPRTESHRVDSYPATPRQASDVPDRCLLDTPIGAKSSVKLRQQHLSVLTTILHRCLLDGDYIHAGRAWGLLLRAEVGGRGAHIRSDGRWGVGAEVLLRRDSHHPRGQSSEDELLAGGHEDEMHFGEGDRSISSVYCDANAVARAQDYYERLILEYPYSTIRAHTVNSLDFYPAMFGLWIYSAQEPRQVARTGERHRKIVASSDRSRSRSSSADRERHDLTDLCTSELLAAQAIAARMDELLCSPPYSDDNQIWTLRGMVSLWLADLYVSSKGTASAKDVTLDANNVEQMRRGQDTNFSRDDETQKARRIFQRLRQNGEQLPATVLSMLDDEDG